jgi:sarcosine oxidase
VDVQEAVHDAIVIGVGGMGSATLYHLARRGWNVLGIEQFDIPHELGSSHGVSRIIRLAYAEDPRYVPLLRRSYELWRELEHRAGERLLIITGGIDAGPRNSETIEGSLRSCAEHHLPHELLDADALQQRFPGYRLPSHMAAVHQPDAGFLLPERCVVAHVEAAQKLGAEVHAREAVQTWCVENAIVIVETNKATYRAKKLIVTAGAWARTLLPFLHDRAVPERQVLIWTQPLRPELFALGAFPIFNLEAEEGRFYGFPVHGVPGFKIGKYHHRHETGDADDIDRNVHPEDEAVLREGIARYFPDANGPTMAMKSCLFTNSPDEHFYLDLHPEHPEVAIAAGFSGHGFKFCSVVGEIMADLAMEGRSRHDIDMFAINRRQ